MPCNRGRSLLIACLSFLTILSAAARAAEPAEPFLRWPDIHGDQVVFTCEGDLWLGSIQRHDARRITDDPGYESNAHFSPDGRTLAFSAQYDGGTDVYVMPVAGGRPRRLTYTPSGARVLGWTPDGRSVLFRARDRDAIHRNRLFAVHAGGGMSQPLPIPEVQHAAMNPDGRHVAYVPISAEWQHWYHYRGGQADDIWMADLVSHTFRRLTTYPGIDTTPAWAGRRLYFVSDRGGLFNLYQLDLRSLKARPVTRYADYGIAYPSSDGRRIVFEHGHGLALYDPATRQTQELRFALNSDRIHARAHRIPLLPSLDTAAIGPTGKRIFVEARGQILSVPVKHGDSRLMASLPGSRSQYPAWSADGKQMAFISDRSGEDQAWVCPSDGSGTPRQLTRDHRGPLDPPLWSPDGRWIATGDRDMRILLVSVATGVTTLVDQSDRGGSYDDTNYSYRFSPDSRWLTFTRVMPNWNDVVFLYNIATDKKAAVTSAEMDSYAPTFSPDGKYLLCFQDREFDHVRLAPSGFSFDRATRVSLITLAKGTPSPFLPQDDEEGVAKKPGAADKKAADATAGATKTSAKPKTNAPPKPPPPTQIDLEGITDRVVDVPMPAGRYLRLDAVDGRLLILARPDAPPSPSAPPNQLIAFDMKKRTSKTIIDHLTDFDVSADHKKLLIRTDKQFAVMDATADALPADAPKPNLGSLMLTVDPEAEWRQIFNESWRIARDFYYDPNMHGLDWEAVKRKYAAELPSVADRSDLNEILGDMIAELNTGHAYVGGGDSGIYAPNPAMGYLGADLEPVPGKNAYRITKLLAGDGFDLSARSPLLAPGVNVKPGDYILAVAGRPVRSDQDIQALLIGTAGQTTSLTVNGKPTLDGSRQVRVVPMATESMARYYDWVASRRRYVLEHGGPNLAYIHLPDMEYGGLREFTKHYYANLNKDGIIYDVRHNGGGFVDALLLLQMSSKPYTYFKPRYGASWTRQDWAFAGDSVALCSDQSYSDAEEFCDAFQRLKVGPVIGTRTWGGEVGSGGGYPLIDGGRLYIPNYGEWAPDGRWVVEGRGVVPDIEVENDPASVMAGRDPQLDRAIAYLKAELAKHPIVRPTPPPFPVERALGASTLRAHPRRCQ